MLGTPGKQHVQLQIRPNAPHPVLDNRTMIVSDMKETVREKNAAREYVATSVARLHPLRTTGFRIYSLHRTCTRRYPFKENAHLIL